MIRSPSRHSSRVHDRCVAGPGVVARCRCRSRTCTRPRATLSKLGLVAFANSGRPAAQEPFLRGLALLHSFEYDEAAEGFRDAQQADPGFAMAFWGEALTYSHLLWGEDDPVAARAALARLAPTPPSASPRPARRGNGRSARPSSRCSSTPIWPSRVRGFADAMRKVAAEYPDDPDAAAFTSLALMFADYQGKLSATRSASAQIRRHRVCRARVSGQPRAPRRHALPDSCHRQPGHGAARSRCRQTLRGPRPRRRTRAPHAFAHLSAARHVGRHRRLERARLGGLARRDRREEAFERRLELPCAALAPVRLPAAGPLRRLARN